MTSAFGTAGALYCQDVYGGGGRRCDTVFMSTSLRALIDTLGHTGITMKIYCCYAAGKCLLNYCFIFGKLGMPHLGGVGAGVATGITYWLEFAILSGSCISCRL